MTAFIISQILRTILRRDFRELLRYHPSLIALFLEKELIALLRQDYSDLICNRIFTLLFIYVE